MPRRFLGAFKKGHRHGVREYIDDDFSYELLQKANGGCKESEAALDWLTKYNNEYYRGALRKNDPTAIHSSDKHYKEATRDHNTRRRDLTSALKSGAFAPGSSLLSIEENSEILKVALNKNPNLGHEEVMIELISEKTLKRLTVLKKQKP